MTPSKGIGRGRRPRKRKVRKGQRFTRLKVIDPNLGRNKYRHYTAFVRCDCGQELVVVINRLINGTTKSCGCLWREETAARIAIAHKIWVQSPAGRAHMSKLASDPDRRKDASERMKTSPAILAGKYKWNHSAENANQLRSIGQRPEVRAIRRQTMLILRDTHPSPDLVPDQDWCNRHDISFWDHSASQRRQRCWKTWNERQVAS
jgi:hypothetical protein